MKRNFISVLILFVMALSGCVASSMGPKGDLSSVKRVAVVSFSVSDWGGSVKYGSVGKTPVHKLLESAVNKMLTDTEEMLSQKWSVVKAETFVKESKYQRLGVEKTLSVYVPKVKGKEMAVFTQVSGEIKSGKIDPQTAINLCKALSVDGVVLVFSEWTTKTGGMIPMTKAVTKNVVTIWDKNGRLASKKRVDNMGRKALGGFGVKAVNENTITEWCASFNTAMGKIVSSI